MDEFKKSLRVIDDSTLIYMFEDTVKSTTLKSARLTPEVMQYRLKRLSVVKEELLRRLQFQGVR